MILKANQKYIDLSSVRHLLACGEKNVDFLRFQIENQYHDIDLSSCNFILRAVNSAGNLIEQTLKKQVDSAHHQIFLTWTVDEYFTAVPGALKSEILGILGDDLVIRFDLSEIIVRENLTGEGVPEIPDATVIQGEKGDKGDTGETGKSAYEVWLALGNTGTESDFLQSLKGEKGDTGEKGEPGKDGANGIDGFSPGIEISENTENSYKLRITDKNGSFETPNLKGKDGADGISGGESSSIIIDTELSGTSENPVQNKIISNQLSLLENQISNLNDLISAIQIGGGNLKITTVFDNSDYETYRDFWTFRCSQWDGRIFSFDEVTTKNTAFCNEENGYSMRFSNSFGWGADVTAVCSEPIRIDAGSILIVEYHCTSDGDGMTAEIIPESDFTVQKSAEFEVIPAFYAMSAFLSANFKAISLPESGNYYLRLKVTTTNPMFTIRKISVVTLE